MIDELAWELSNKYPYNLYAHINKLSVKDNPYYVFGVNPVVLFKAVESLNPRERDAALMRYQENLTLREMAERIKKTSAPDETVTPNRAGQILNRAERRLRQSSLAGEYSFQQSISMLEGIIAEKEKELRQADRIIGKLSDALYQRKEAGV